MKKITLTAIGLIAALAAGSAFAEHHEGKDGKGHHGKMFEHTDGNKDGSISKAEWQAKGDSMFNEIDANKDGNVTKEEMKAHHEQKRAEWIKNNPEKAEKLKEFKEKKIEEKKAEKPAVEKH